MGVVIMEAGCESCGCTTRVPSREYAAGRRKCDRCLARAEAERLRYGTHALQPDGVVTAESRLLASALACRMCGGTHVNLVEEVACAHARSIEALDRIAARKPASVGADVDSEEFFAPRPWWRRLLSRWAAWRARSRAEPAGLGTIGSGYVRERYTLTVRPPDPPAMRPPPEALPGRPAFTAARPPPPPPLRVSPPPGAGTSTAMKPPRTPVPIGGRPYRA